MTRTIAAALALCIATPAMSAECYDRPTYVSVMREDFQSVPIIYGYSSDANVLMEIVADAAGNWTLLETYPTGLICVIGRGTGFAFNKAGN